jgi:hypothetical protein
MDENANLSATKWLMQILWCPQCLKRGKKAAPAANRFHDFLPKDRGKGSLIKSAT